MAVTGEAPDVVCTLPAALETVVPDPHEVERCRERHETYRRLYRDLKGAFAAHAAAS
jgi:xylulokinase